LNHFITAALTGIFHIKTHLDVALGVLFLWGIFRLL
jgi:hypothetical protein